ncbi:DUF1905 domain-containing protein [Cellulomonas sp. McL0617]|uniref:DUF1905 domain-containing protein n=1 Tax=Cellulomonas sp. McL0617 TaxID=3415675 RepID=UPI003CF38244
MTYTFDAPLWRWAARTETWTFVSVPAEISDEILDLAGPTGTRGFGSLPVEVEIGPVLWRTSIFPGDAGYALPIKKAVRAANGADVGDVLHVRLTLR